MTTYHQLDQCALEIFTICLEQRVTEYRGRALSLSFPAPIMVA